MPENHSNPLGILFYMKKLTQSEVLFKLQSIYGDELDFSKFQYINNTVKSKVICKKHGVFESTSLNLYKKKGCPKCRHQIIKDKFYKYCENIHNGKYEYLDDYENKHSLISIICTVHGIFKQEANHHYRGHGCSKCIGKYRRNNEEFIMEFRKIHNDKYLYDDYIDINTSDKIDIYCKEHGKFSQNVSHHLKGGGCPKCAGKGLSKEELIDKFNTIHNKKYDYSEMDYNNSLEKIKIKCPHHGNFLQSPNSHFNGSGCPECKKIKISQKNSKTKEYFLNKFKLIHGEKYDYSLNSKIYSNKHLEIICDRHGIFKQSSSNHLQGRGCPKCGCNISKPEIELQDFVKSLNVNIKTNKKNIIAPLELDIYIPELQKAIEFNGTWWHYNHENPKCKPKGYHGMKSKLCKKLGIKLLHIREDLWLRDKNQMKQIILKFLQK